MFEQPAKQLEPPYTLQEAGIRDHLKAKAVKRGVMQKPKSQGGRTRVAEPRVLLRRAGTPLGM